MRGNFVTLLCGGTCLLLAALLAWMLALPPKPIPDVAALAARTNINTANASAQTPTPLQAYDEISRRPLFTPTRRPLPPPAIKATPTVQPAKPPPSLVLLGTIITDSERIAFVRLAEQPHGQAIRVDETIGDWKVTEIRADTVVLKSGALTHAIISQTGNAAPPPSRPMPSSPVTRSNQIRR